MITSSNLRPFEAAALIRPPTPLETATSNPTSKPIWGLGSDGGLANSRRRPFFVQFCPNCPISQLLFRQNESSQSYFSLFCTWLSQLLGQCWTQMESGTAISLSSRKTFVGGIKKGFETEQNMHRCQGSQTSGQEDQRRRIRWVFGNDSRWIIWSLWFSHPDDFYPIEVS